MFSYTAPHYGGIGTRVPITQYSVPSIHSIIHYNDLIFYSEPVECPAFSVDGSTQGNWTASPVGTTVTIKCAATHILVGNATLTCEDGGSWSSDEPDCDEVGELLVTFQYNTDMTLQTLHDKIAFLAG